MGPFPSPDSRPALDALSTSLKWGRDGELSPVDLQRVLERLQNPELVECSLSEDAGLD